MSGTYVYICSTCGHYDHYGPCRTCGHDPKPEDIKVEEVRDQKMVIIDSPAEMDKLRRALTNAYKLRISWHGDHITIKANERMWSAPMGKFQGPY